MKRTQPRKKVGRSFQERTYRQGVLTSLHQEQVVVQETDLAIFSAHPIAGWAKEEVIRIRGQLERYIAVHPQFATTLVPWPEDELAPALVRSMVRASRKAGVGPMAAVAGAIAEMVGQDLLAHADEVIVENGGDIFLCTAHDVTLGILAGASPLSLKVALELKANRMPLGVCTSSGSVGHSLSFGRADAACVISPSCSLADAAATAIGNRVRKASDISAAIQWGQRIEGVLGIVVIIADKIGAWGEVHLVPL